MRASLRWALFASTLATLAVLAFTGDGSDEPSRPLIPPSVRARVAFADRFGDAPTGSSAAPAIRPPGAVVAKAVVDTADWPETLPRQELNAAARDPFESIVPPTTPAHQVVNQAPLPSPAVTPPVAPSMPYRYLGQLTDPEGKRLILIAKGDKEIPVSAGTQLDDGFSVKSVHAHAVALVHTATNTSFEIRIPESDDSTPR